MAALVTLTFTWGCGGAAPAAPAPPTSRLHLRAGPQILDVTGFGISSDPQFPPCTPLLAPPAGTMVSARVSLEQSGSEWIARSLSPSDGSIELHVRDTSTSTVLGDLVAGTIQGSAVDAGEGLRPPNGVTVTLGDATLEGTVQRTAFLTIGRIAGSIAFKDAANATGTCAAVEWLMEPVSGIFPVVGLVLPQPPW